MTACGYPGCGGTVQDGYCDTCGLAPAARQAPAAPPPAPVVPTPRPAAGAGSAPVSGGGPPSVATAVSGSTGRTGRTGSTRSRRGLLGAGLVEVPPVPYRDPAEVVLRDPQVPEEKRFCSNPDCGRPVGRSRGDRPGRPDGFCPHCGTRFSFTPKLREGDLVGGQYEVKGCLAHGGLGWIYLAADRNLDGRWVVLKGLLDTGDVEALAAAEAERRFLTGVDHPNIVKIFNFVQHPDPTTGAMVGYIVMEYVGGQSLQDILRRRLRESGNREALPPAQAIAYALETLRAFDYLHDRGLLYCDLKPANIIQVEEQLKLIDLGAVRRVDDADSAIYGTIGYQAPEIAADGPSYASDLYTVGRTLAVLSFPFSPVKDGAAAPLPSPAEEPVLAAHDSFHRFLLRATHPNPAWRFPGAAAMADQLTGVLREIRAAEDGIPYPAPSTLFGPERVTAGTALAPGTAGTVFEPLDRAAAVAALPVPLVDPADPAAGFLAGLTARGPGELVAILEAAPVRSPETRFALARVLAEQGASGVAEVLALAAQEVPEDWRIPWYQGVRELAAGDLTDAVRVFDDLYGRMPGEPAPRLALAFGKECVGDFAGAAGHYAAIWRTDHSYVSAAFGLARARLAAGDGPGATAVLDEVPASSSHYLAARTAAVAIAVRGRAPDRLAPADLVTAGERLDALDLDARRRDELAAEVLECALGWLDRGGRTVRQTSLLGAPFTERGVRRELERVYRALARGTARREDRHALVCRANKVRPRTWI
jgi:serine/threonine-protein kinase PknG